MMVNPGLTEYLSPPTAFVLITKVKGVFAVLVLRIADIERVRCGTHADDRFAGIRVVDNVLHLIFR